MNIFEKASKIKLRFDTVKGPLSVEDLWSIPLLPKNGSINLDEIARELNKKLKSGDDVSFVLPDKKTDEVTQLKFDIVKHIIEVKLADAEAAKRRKADKEQKKKILEIVAKKRDASLEEKSEEDLLAMIAELGIDDEDDE